MKILWFGALFLVASAIRLLQDENTMDYPKDVVEAFKLIDTNNDGLIQIEEMVKMMEQTVKDLQRGEGPTLDKVKSLRAFYLRVGGNAGLRDGLPIQQFSQFFEKDGSN